MNEHIALGINYYLKLSTKRYEHIISTYSSLSEAVDDGFELCSLKDIEVLKPISKDAIYNKGYELNEEMSIEGVQYVMIGEKNYPKRLDSIKQKPVILYYKGNINLLNNHNTSFISCVGSRNITQQTTLVLERLMRDLRQKNCSIVSGLANGVDNYAHLSCLDNSIPAVGVLGTSLFASEYYPQTTFSTSQRIIATDGVILSECGKGEGGMRHSFVLRNRLIAGLSHCLCVLQAKKGSGSCLTAKYAFEYSIPVLSVAGIPYDPYFEGNRDLLRKGADVLMDSSDIIKKLSLAETDNSNQPQEDYLKTIDLSDKEKKLLEILSMNPTNIDLIIRCTGFQSNEVTKVLVTLELKRIVKMVGGNCWIKVV